MVRFFTWNNLILLRVRAFLHTEAVGASFVEQGPKEVKKIGFFSPRETSDYSHTEDEYQLGLYVPEHRHCCCWDLGCRGTWSSVSSLIICVTCKSRLVPTTDCSMNLSPKLSVNCTLVALMTFPLCHFPDISLFQTGNCTFRY